jgi:GTP cyclohydrolase I
MKQNGTLLNVKANGLELADLIGDDHISTSMETPLRADAFEMSDEAKMAKIAVHFKKSWKRWVWTSLTIH